MSLQYIAVVTQLQELYPQYKHLYKHLQKYIDKLYGNLVPPSGTPNQQKRWKSNTGQYHQFVTISEKTINEQLRNYWATEPKLQKLSCSLMVFGSIEAETRLYPLFMTPRIILYFPATYVKSR